jgi:hypothetical protein
MKKLIALVAAALLVVSVGSTPAQAAEPFNHLNLKPADDEAIMVIGEDTGPGLSSSRMSVQPPAAANFDQRGEWVTCGGLDDKTCDITNPKLDILSWALLPHCDNATGDYCIEKLEIAIGQSAFVEAKFIGEAEGIRYRGDAQSQLIEAAAPSRFIAEGQNHQGGNATYSVSVNIAQGYSHTQKRFLSGNVTANVAPYNEILGDFEATRFVGGDPRYSYSGKSKAGCVWVEDGKCGYRQDFAAETRVRLTLNIPSTLGGWFSGRMKSPTITISEKNNATSKVVVEAESVSIPQLAFVKKRADIVAEKTLNVGKSGEGVGEVWGLGAGSEDVFKFMELYRKDMKDTAAGVVTAWNYMTIASLNGNKCLKDKSKVLGIVTTNAMGYDTGSPQFNNGFLNYKVGGLHFMPDGKTEVQGTYDLVMRSETARCLYGFSKAPISATVSVVGGNSNSVATTVVSEKDGWMKMAAYGFTFSQKTIRVKMTQKATASKTTITCVKGKVTKKVTASAPKCPAGYRQK